MKHRILKFLNLVNYILDICDTWHAIHFISYSSIRTAMWSSHRFCIVLVGESTALSEILCSDLELYPHVFTKES